MTLTLEEVRKVRFPMVKRPGEGYRAIGVALKTSRVHPGPS